MRNIFGQTIKSIHLQSCIIEGCKALCSNTICKKCADRLEALRAAELEKNKLEMGIVAAEYLDHQLYGKVTPIEHGEKIGLLQNDVRTPTSLRS